MKDLLITQLQNKNGSCNCIMTSWHTHLGAREGKEEGGHGGAEDYTAF